MHHLDFVRIHQIQQKSIGENILKPRFESSQLVDTYSLNCVVCLMHYFTTFQMETFNYDLTMI